MRCATPLALALALVWLLAACAGSSSSDSNGSMDTGGATADPGTVTSDMPTINPNAGGGAVDAGMPTGDAEMNARIPTSVDGETITVTGTNLGELPAGVDAAAMFAGGDTLTTWLQEHGKTWADVSIASAMTENISAEAPDQKTAFLTAIRVKGASPDELMGWFTGSANMQGREEENRKTIGSREVAYYGLPGVTTCGLYLWAEGDTVYWVGNASSESFAEAFITAIN